MELANSFTQDTRNLYLGIWFCWGVTEDGSYCGSNGSDCGGLELHHVLGRRKHIPCLSSALNSAVLCKRCHDRVTHSLDEHRQLFLKTLKFLNERGYKLNEVDVEFLNIHAQELFGKEIQIWSMQ